MNELDRIGIFLADLPVYLANGILLILYWLAAHLPILVCMVCAGIIALLPDEEIQQRAGFRPRRGAQGEENGVEVRRPRTAQITTLIVVLLWLIAQWDMASPVPWIGAVMWLAGLAAILMAAVQRFNLVWYVKAGLAMYALAVIGSRIYLSYTAQLSPDQWAALIGSSESAAVVIANTRGNVTTILLWALWLVIPIGYFSLLVQQIFINPMSIVSPFAGAQDMLRALRVRKS